MPLQPFTQRGTAWLQARRAALLALSREWTLDERGEVAAIERELVKRQVLSIGINF